MTEWQPRALALAGDIAAKGFLTDPAWRAAFEAVPRHLFVPRFYLGPDEQYRLVDGSDPVLREEWLTAVYSDESLATQLITVPGTDLKWATSSSTMPSLMARMLHLLDIHNGHRVLEIGTGTGYNLALLCHRLGDAKLASVDLHPALIDRARARLARLGYRPHLAARNGVDGLREHAPYDRIMATCAVPRIPTAWITQLAPGGIIVTDLRGEIASTLAVLYKTDDTAVEGRLLNIPGDFMWLRAAADNPLRDGGTFTTTVDRRGSSLSHITVDPTILTNPDYLFWLQHHEPTLQPIWASDSGPMRISTIDGAWAELPTGLRSHVVTQGGNRDIWSRIETVAYRWRQLGQPARDRFGLTVTSQGEHRLWLDRPDTTAIRLNDMRGHRAIPQGEQP